MDVPRKTKVEHTTGLGWSPTGNGDEVVFTCPNSHRLVLFNREQPAPRHGIAADGTVDGSVVCRGRPKDPCDFHQFIRLLDYDGRAITRL